MMVMMALLPVFEIIGRAECNDRFVVAKRLGSKAADLVAALFALQLHDDQLVEAAGMSFPQTTL